MIDQLWLAELDAQLSKSQLNSAQMEITRLQGVIDQVRETLSDESYPLQERVDWLREYIDRRPHVTTSVAETHSAG